MSTQSKSKKSPVSQMIEEAPKAPVSPIEAISEVPPMVDTDSTEKPPISNSVAPQGQSNDAPKPETEEKLCEGIFSFSVPAGVSPKSLELWLKKRNPDTILLANFLSFDAQLKKNLKAIEELQIALATAEKLLAEVEAEKEAFVVSKEWTSRFKDASGKDIPAYSPVAQGLWAEFGKMWGEKISPKEAEVNRLKGAIEKLENGENIMSSQTSTKPGQESSGMGSKATTPSVDFKTTPVIIFNGSKAALVKPARLTSQAKAQDLFWAIMVEAKIDRLEDGSCSSTILKAAAADNTAGSLSQPIRLTSKATSQGAFSEDIVDQLRELGHFSGETRSSKTRFSKWQCLATVSNGDKFSF